MKEKYIKIQNLSVSDQLFRFVNNELLHGTKIRPNFFWKEFSKNIHELSLKNKKILQTREKLQKKNR